MLAVALSVVADSLPTSVGESPSGTLASSAPVRTSPRVMKVAFPAEIARRAKRG